nr:MAG TPA: hypothetical protein [Caudoviricetes sp.]
MFVSMFIRTPPLYLLYHKVRINSTYFSKKMR